MQTSVRRMGNSAEIILPKSTLAELGVKAGDHLSLSLEKGRLILMPAMAPPRSGRAKASTEIVAAGDDCLVWPKFQNLVVSRLMLGAPG